MKCLLISNLATRKAFGIVTENGEWFFDPEQPDQPVKSALRSLETKRDHVPMSEYMDILQGRTNYYIAFGNVTTEATDPSEAFAEVMGRT